MDVYSPCKHNRATGSWRRNRNLKIYINKSAKLHKESTPEQCSYEMTMTIFSGPPHLLALLNSTFIWFSRWWCNNWPHQTKTFIRLLFFSNFASSKQFFHFRSLIQKWFEKLRATLAAPCIPRRANFPRPLRPLKRKQLKPPSQIKPTFIPRPCFLGHKLHSFGIWLLVAAVWWGK